MTDEIASFSFDRALDGEDGFDLDDSEQLLKAAQMTQSLFDRQHVEPSEEFILKLEQTLFPSVVAGLASVARETDVVIRPSLSQSHEIPHRPRFRREIVAVAAALVLLLGGIGSILWGALGSYKNPEPGSIPAVSFVTVIASPEPIAQAWTIDVPSGQNGSDRPGIITNGVMLRTFYGSNHSPVQAVDLQTGRELWYELPRISPDVMTATDDLFLIAGSNGSRYELVAFESRSGDERWSRDLGERPVGLLVDGVFVYVLASDDVLEKFELETQERVWQSALDRFVDAGVQDGVNSFSGFTGDRIAVADGNVAAILSNGRLVAVDSTVGQPQWANTRRTHGWTRLAVVDGKFVVTAFGENAFEDATGTDVGMSSSSGDPCQLAVRPREGTEATRLDGLNEAVDSFDPKTGESPWGVVLSEAYSVWPLNDSQLVAQIGPGWSATSENDDVPFDCIIDGADGTVSETDGIAFIDFLFPVTETGEVSGFGILSGAVPFWVSNLDPIYTQSLTTIGFDAQSHGGIRWIQRDGDWLLITGQDGSLTGFESGG